MTISFLLVLLTTFAILCAMRWRWLARRIALPILLTGCAFTSADVLHMTCDTNDDCVFTNILVCNSASNTCEPRIDDGGIGCRIDGDCVAGLTCESVQLDGVCLETLGQGQGPCTEVTCMDGLTCTTTNIGDICLASIGAGCVTSEDCTTPAVCASPALGAALECLIPVEAGTTCGQDESCESGICEDGSCVLDTGAVCETHEDDCSAGLVCRPDTVGTDRCQAPGELLDTCDTNDDCGSAFTCEDSVCLAVRGTSCSSDYTCSDPYVCRPDDAGFDRCLEVGGPGDVCDSQNDCARGECSSATGICPQEAGGHCQTESECLDDLRCAVGSGEERLCQSMISGCGECDSDDDCDGTWCVAGYCQQALENACDTSACCPDGTTCRSQDGHESATCQIPADTVGAYCADDTGCASWLTCSTGECRVPEGGACNTTEDCVGSDLTCMIGSCTQRSGYGEVCVDEAGNGPYDDACQAGLLCGATLTCIAPLSVPEGGACNRSAECSSPMSCFTNICSF